ncbi:alpha/beta fold hydrolase [Fodinicola feengrottensis]|uniref:Alpha/beta fold hydrolase n=1 Tax=Fodinicola feengrottensis TaxID=435914 RepID=A0ABN2FQX0_9ACTN|nr:alpha/beta fold hydrolase [Fodinicola feengrottensis]
MATYVLVPGGWHGGWYFEPLAQHLRWHGHQAYAVTLSGVGDRHHLRSAAVNLDTHIQDVLSLLETEQITDAVLCGHSYGGMVVSGVADRAPERVEAVTYCDAYLPQDGDSCWSLTSDVYRGLFLANATGDGQNVEPPAGMDPRATSQPLATFLQAIQLTGAELPTRRHFVYLSGWSGTPFASTYERLSQDATWKVHDLPVGHNVMRLAGDDLLKILLEV